MYIYIEREREKEREQEREREQDLFILNETVSMLFKMYLLKIYIWHQNWFTFPEINFHVHTKKPFVYIYISIYLYTRTEFILRDMVTQLW